jgi:hypothetical protein
MSRWSLTREDDLPFDIAGTRLQVVVLKKQILTIFGFS